MTESEVGLLHDQVGLFDRSEQGKLALTGSGAKAFLNGQVSNDVEALEPGEGLSAALLTPKGKILAELRVLDLGDELWLDTDRPSLQAVFDTVRRFSIGRDVSLHKRTLECALLSLIGPGARAAAGAEALPGADGASMRARRGGVDVVLVATDVGVDVICGTDDAEAVRAALAVPTVSEDAAEVVRVERGRPRYGIDLDDATIPQEAGLNERLVSFTKGCYVGQETVARLFYRGRPNRHLRGLRLEGTGATGDVLRLGEREVGRLGSVVASPRFGPVALALVRREAAVGDVLAVGDGAGSAEVVALPFA